MIKKITVKQLRLGMYVSELDRPWLETPFLFQGFFISSEQDIRDIAKVSQHVYIDTLRGSDLPDEGRGAFYPTAPAVVGIASKTNPYIRETPIEDEIEVAQSVRAKTREYVDDVFESIRRGGSVDLANAKAAVSELVDSVVRNPSAQMCLAQLKSRDEYTAQHSVNVCVLSIALGRHMGMDKHALNILGLSGLLHDIGKLQTPLEVLNKPGRLTEEEFRIMQTHPVNGRDILMPITGMPDTVIDVAYSHHERLKGHGYPNKRQGDEISSWSRMVAIVDVYDAITSDRCYHDGMGATEALTRMYNWKDRDFDPMLLEQFIQCIGIYPIGSLVELTTAEIGIVIATNPGHRLKPKVMLVLDEHKNPYYPARIVDLARDSGNGIGKVLEPGAYNISIKEHMQQMPLVLLAG